MAFRCIVFLQCTAFVVGLVTSDLLLRSIFKVHQSAHALCFSTSLTDIMCMTRPRFLRVHDGGGPPPLLDYAARPSVFSSSPDFVAAMSGQRAMHDSSIAR